MLHNLNNVTHGNMAAVHIRCYIILLNNVTQQYGCCTYKVLHNDNMTQVKENAYLQFDNSKALS